MICIRMIKERPLSLLLSPCHLHEATQVGSPSVAASAPSPPPSPQPANNARQDPPESGGGGTGLFRVPSSRNLP